MAKPYPQDAPARVAPGFRPPSPPARAAITLLLRLGLGLPMLNTGVGTYLAIQGSGGMFPGSGSRNPYWFQDTGVFPGAEGVLTVLPYVQIVVGLALVLGFLTTLAAFLAGVLSLTLPLSQAFVLMVIGYPYNRGIRDAFFVPTQTYTGNAVTLMLSVLTMWLASAGENRWSLDALMFRRGEAAGVGEVPAPSAPRAQATDLKPGAVEPEV